VNKIFQEPWLRILFHVREATSLIDGKTGNLLHFNILFISRIPVWAFFWEELERLIKIDIQTLW
jgi:hypothetical protein